MNSGVYNFLIGVQFFVSLPESLSVLRNSGYFSGSVSASLCLDQPSHCFTRNSRGCISGVQVFFLFGGVWMSSVADSSGEEEVEDS